MFVNISAEAKNPSIRMNLLRGSSLCIGVSSLVNLNPWTNLSDKLNQLFRGRGWASTFSRIRATTKSLAAYASMISEGVPRSVKFCIRVDI